MSQFKFSKPYKGIIKRVEYQFDPELLREHHRKHHMLVKQQSKHIVRNVDLQENREIIPYLKIDIIYAYKVHTQNKKEISQMVGLKYCTVLNIINSFEKYGRIFKFLHKNSKVFLLKHRVDSVDSQRVYKQFRRTKFLNI